MIHSKKKGGNTPKGASTGTAAKAATTGRDTAKRRNLAYAVVHSTGTATLLNLNEVDQLPYHYLISKGGKLVRLKRVQPTDGTIEIGLVGGINGKGCRCDDHNEAQKTILFHFLLHLMDKYPNIKFRAADELYRYPFANPAFHLNHWMAGMITRLVAA